MSIISTTVPAALAREMANAGPIAVLTGAGVSAESGVPTFRDAQTGLWARFNPSELATPAAFAKNPQRVWEWYAWRRALVAQAEPNAGHRALAAIERRIADFTLITQNVDGLHQRAGSRRIVELHGNIARVKCSREGVLVATWRQDGPVPRCPACGALLRPDVVWFEEALPAGALATAEAARCSSASRVACRRRSAWPRGCRWLHELAAPSSSRSIPMQRRCPTTRITCCAGRPQRSCRRC